MRLLGWLLAGWLLALAATAQTRQAPAAATPGPAEDRRLGEWLLRMHDASRRRAYVGTFVVSVGSSMSSARIWHVCDGEQQMERVETLTGPVVGAAIFTWLRDEVARRTEFWRAVLGLTILAIVLLFPQGLVGGLKALANRWRESRA